MAAHMPLAQDPVTRPHLDAREMGNVVLWGWSPLPGTSRLLCPRDSPGKNTGVGYHFLLQGIFPTQGSLVAIWSVCLATEGSDWPTKLVRLPVLWDIGRQLSLYPSSCMIRKQPPS